MARPAKVDFEIGTPVKSDPPPIVRGSVQRTSKYDGIIEFLKENPGESYQVLTGVTVSISRGLTSRGANVVTRKSQNQSDPSIVDVWADWPIDASTADAKPKAKNNSKSGGGKKSIPSEPVAEAAPEIKRAKPVRAKVKPVAKPGVEVAKAPKGRISARPKPAADNSLTDGTEEA